MGILQAITSTLSPTTASAALKKPTVVSVPVRQARLRDQDSFQEADHCDGLATMYLG